ncbi:MAG: HAMP domain-containing histidine kinase [Alphaproteobacteria bacterium]|nr:HAMP domain-containing histidine kinase [Alphaproteobacteria bacterium]MCW5740645.1 HAMP domain-containing histidine kinase [Alphaproteobacteria bacterium]
MTETSPAHTGVMNSLRRVIAASAHELNQPLNAIQLLADNALDELNDFGAGDRDTEVLSLAQRLEAIADQVQLAAEIIRGFREFGPAQAGRVAGPSDVTRLMDRFQRLFAKEAKLLGVELEVVVAEDRRCGVIDEWLLQLAMIELISAWGDRERAAGDAKAPVRIEYLDGEDGAPAALAVSGPAPLPASVAGSAVEAWGKARGCGTRPAQAGDRVTLELLLPD